MPPPCGGGGHSNLEPQEIIIYPNAHIILDKVFHLTMSDLEPIRNPKDAIIESIGCDDKAKSLDDNETQPNPVADREMPEAQIFWKESDGGKKSVVFLVS